MFLFFFFNDTATTEIYTLSLHDALPISLPTCTDSVSLARPFTPPVSSSSEHWNLSVRFVTCALYWRSEEHTSELQSHLNLVCRLLLEKKKKNTNDFLVRQQSQPAA